MNTVRLFLGDRGAWAVVRCDHCQGVYKYPSMDAIAAPLTCVCGVAMMLCRAYAEVMNNAKAPIALGFGTGRRDRDSCLQARSAGPEHHVNVVGVVQAG